MKLWWKLWAGHVYLVLTVLSIATALIAIATVLLATDSDVMYYAFVIGILAFLLAIIFGILSPYTMQNKRQRHYLRMDADLAQETAERHRKATEPRRTVSYSDGPSEAYSTNERDSDER